MVKFLCLIFSFGLFNLFSQDSLILKQAEQKLKTLGDVIISDSSKKDRVESLYKFNSLIEKTLSIENSFDYLFDSVKTLSKIKSPDNRFNIYTWTYFDDQKNYKHFGFIQFKSKKILKLIDKSNKINKPSNKILSPSNWFGMFYYNIIKKNQVYILLGWNGYDRYSSKKIIEPMYIDKGEKVFFGKKIFKGKYESNYRIIFHYSDLQAIKLNYGLKCKCIFYSNIGSIRGLSKDLPRFLIPDGTYNALFFDNGYWREQEKIKPEIIR